MDKNVKQDIKKLPLDRILINNGYYYDKEKTSQNYKVVKTIMKIKLSYLKLKAAIIYILIKLPTITSLL